MSELDIRREQLKENLCKPNDVSFSPGVVFIDTLTEGVMMVVESEGLISELLQEHLDKHDKDALIPDWEDLDPETYVLAVGLEDGSLVLYEKPFKRMCKQVHSARLYVKE